MEFSKAPLEVLRETRRQLAVQLALVEAEIQRREASSVPEPADYPIIPTRRIGSDGPAEY